MRPTDDQLIKAFEQASPAIRESLTEGKAVDFMVSLTTRYHLHIDTAGYVTEFIRNMLLGFLKPEEFMGKLQSVGISELDARQLISDLNREVFVPLRNEVRNAVPGTAASPASNIPQTPAPQITATPAPAPEPAPIYNLAVKAPPAPVSASEVRTMQQDMQEIQHSTQTGHATTPELKVAPPPFKPTPIQTLPPLSPTPQAQAIEYGNDPYREPIQ